MPDVAADMRHGAPEELGGLSPEERLRYGRHLLLPEVGLAGQRRLKTARVLLVGAGGLGSPLALYLAAAGVGTIGLVDDDVVELTNLQRQILHSTADIGRLKVDSGMERIAGLNPSIAIERYPLRLSSQNALAIMSDYDLVIDGSDNFATRYLTNDACVMLGKPTVYGSIFRFEGQVSLLAAPDGPCYRCLYPTPPPPGEVPSCAEGGVLGVLPGIIGTLQAAEAIKYLLGIGTPLVGRLLLVNVLDMRFRTLQIRKDSACPACGTRSQQLVDYAQFCGDTTPDKDVPELTPRVVADRLRRGHPLDLIDVREPHEWEIARIPGARLVPLATLGDVIPTLDVEREIVIHCKSGARSARAVRRLQSAGFLRVWSLAGGIDRWSREVEPATDEN